MKTISYQALTHGADKIRSVSLDARGRGYLRSYPIYLDFFQASEISNHDDFIVRAGLVYSWMPRVLVLSEQDIENAIASIRRFMDSSEKGESDNIISEVAKALNGSYIGASKLLHFQFPNIFPIYDTKVFKNINAIRNDKKNLYHKANKATCYDAYRKSVNNVIAREDFVTRVFDPVNKYFFEQFGYSVSKVRAVEFVVFSNYEMANA